jgi:AcrR family transcriptional regulator
MPRLAGQIDQTKHEAILDAAAAVFGARGLAAPLEDVARAAGVSKQTLYNRFGGREGLIAAMVARRRETVTAALHAPGADDRLEETLTRYAAALLERYLSPDQTAMLRVAVAAVGDYPEAARAIYEAGPAEARRQLAAFLERERKLGRLAFADAESAAETFAGMVAGHVMVGALLGALPRIAVEGIPARARETARRFIRAYAPEDAA